VGHRLVQPGRPPRRIVADIDAASDVVGFTIAEFFPRQVMHLQQILDGFPLISGTATVHRVR
jgi:arginase